MPGAVTLIGAVRGLEAEGVRVAAALDRLEPDVVGMSLSKEALESLVALGADGRADPTAANMEEEAYIRGLSGFGEVIKPPPCFYMAWQTANKTGIRMEALDMDEEHYTMAYCKHVGTLDMMRQGRSRKLFEAHEFEACTPEEFVLEWDGLVNRLKGYRALEKSREVWMAKGIARLTGSHERVVAVIELERFEGVRSELQRAGIEAETER